MKRLFFLIVPAVILFGCAGDEPLAPQMTTDLLWVDPYSAGRPELRVMTWNIYVGTDVDMVLSATDEMDLITKVAAAYEMFAQTSFHERARAIATQIGKERPDLIGLQEVSLIQRFVPNNGKMALAEQLDFLQILLNALQERGLDYRLADSVRNANVTVPRLVEMSGSTPVVDYVNLIDADAILVRGDVATWGTIKGRYQAALPVPAPVFEVPRGYVSVAAMVGNKTYRFVATHLESFIEAVRLPQAQELCATFAWETLPLIIVGDFNTLDPTPPNPYADAIYQYMTIMAGFEDVWVHNLKRNKGAGYTSPFAADLMDPVPNLVERIDLILVRNYGPPAGQNLIGPVQAEVIGDNPKDRTPSGLWPSDHAGVVARLHMADPTPMAQTNFIPLQ